MCRNSGILRYVENTSDQSQHAVTGNELNTWIENNKNTWNQGSYNHSDWFLGTNPQIPRWLGYSMGFKIVKDYIANNPGSLASQLHDEPASSFE